MLQLQHGQQVRVKGFRYAQAIRVFTVRGSVDEYNRTYKPQFPETGDEAIARSIRNGHSINPCCLQDAAVLTDNYRGKQAELDAKAAAKAAAPEITNGETVEIEGQRYTVRVLGEQYSDPVKFDAVA